MKTTEATAITALLQERARQDEKYGGPEHDDQHSYSEWMSYIARRAARLTTDRKMQLQMFVEIGALAIAAIESEARHAGTPAAAISCNNCGTIHSSGGQRCSACGVMIERFDWISGVQR